MRIDATDIGMQNAAEVSAAGIEAIRNGDSVFDLSPVRGCDSSAVAVVLSWLREAQSRGLRLELSNLPPGLVNLADVYGVGPLLDLDETPR